jgi:hypothetical protein
MQQAASTWPRWWAALLFGTLLLLVLMMAAWLLRVGVPVEPKVNLSLRDAPAAPLPPAPPDPTAVLKASLEDVMADQKTLASVRAALEQELATRAGQCKPAAAALVDRRWDQRDLDALKGCWVLGHDVPMIHSFGDGRSERVTVKAGRICFDDKGSGLHEQRTVGAASEWKCKAPVTARFWNNGTLAASQPAVMCDGIPPARWVATTMTCRQINSAMAICQVTDKSGRNQVEFRREH